VEGAIARTLTGDIYRADDRAISSVNRELFAQQQSLAERIRAIKPHVVLAPDQAAAAAAEVAPEDER
jgi:outer membrane murein-binding lipoprotein Lpp